jgi:hypothetical protein
MIVGLEKNAPGSWGRIRVVRGILRRGKTGHYFISNIFRVCVNDEETSR